MQFICQSTYQTIIDIIKREGVLGLYSGLNSSLLGIAVTNGYVYVLDLGISIDKISVYYYFYERSREIILRSRTGGKGLSTLESMLAGLIAGKLFMIIPCSSWR